MDHCRAMMTDPTMTLGTVFLASLLGSAHCLGMCGPLVALTESVRPGRWTPWKQLPLHTGRVVTYSAMGAAAGFAGGAVERTGVAIGFQGAASLTGGALMLFFAAVLIGWARLPWATGVSGHAVTRFTRALSSHHPLSGFALGLFWGLLPCGLVWVFLATAGGVGTPLGGLQVMAVFGAGTLPALLVLGGAGGWIGPRMRRIMPRVAAVSVMLLGVLLMLRGVVVLAL